MLEETYGEKTSESSSVNVTESQVNPLSSFHYSMQEQSEVAADGTRKPKRRVNHADVDILCLNYSALFKKEKMSEKSEEDKSQMIDTFKYFLQGRSRSNSNHSD